MDGGEWYPTMVGHIEALKKEDTAMEDKMEAAKELAALAKSDSLNEQMSRQNSIVHAGGGEALMQCLADSSSEMLQWWAALALTQLVFANERVIELLVDIAAVETAEQQREQEVLAQVEAALRPKEGGKEAQPPVSKPVEEEIGSRGVEGEDEALEFAHLESEHEPARPAGRGCLVQQVGAVMRGEYGYTTDKIKFGCLHILINIANKHWECHKVMFFHSLVNTCLPILRAGNTPALVGAVVSFMCSLSYNHGSKHTLVKTGVVGPIKQIARSEKQQVNSVSANICRMNLEGYAASKMTALGRGFLARRAAAQAARARKMKRLGNFFTNAVVWKCLCMWVRFRLDRIDYRAKTGRALELLFNRSKHVGFAAFVGYTDQRHGKYEREEKADAFRTKSVVGRNQMFARWVEFMREHASWWEADAALEAEAKKRSSKFAALLGGQWVALCFSEWRQLLEKKHKAMKRWANSATFFGWSLWVELMYTDGPWWQPDENLQRLLDEKCHRVVALLAGDFLAGCFREWAVAARKQKKAKVRFLRQAQTHCFDQWFDAVFVDAAELYEKVALRCSKFLALISGEYFASAFKCWKEHALKMGKGKKFLQRIGNRPVVECWDSWVQFMCTEGSWWLPDDATQEQLNAKCGHILALINGDHLRSSFNAWHDLAHKNKIAMKRWTQQVEHWAVGLWTLLVADARHFNAIADSIRHRRRRAHMSETLVDWQFRVQQERYAQSLRQDVLGMWLNVRLVHAFRSLDEFCQFTKYRRAVIAKFQMRWQMRPAQLCLLGMKAYVDQQMNLRWLMNRINNYHALAMLRQWTELVHEVKIEQREQLAASSPTLKRWMQRGMAKCFSLWREKWATNKRNRKILERMAYRIKYACVVGAFHNWNLFVDLNVAERYQDLKEAVAESLRGGTLEVLLLSLRRHHASFFRSTVRWNDFVRTYLQDAMAEIASEEAGEVKKIFNQQRRKKRLRMAEAQKSNPYNDADGNGTTRRQKNGDSAERSTLFHDARRLSASLEVVQDARDGQEIAEWQREGREGGAREGGLRSDLEESREEGERVREEADGRAARAAEQEGRTEVEGGEAETYWRREKERASLPARGGRGDGGKERRVGVGRGASKVGGKARMIGGGGWQIAPSYLVSGRAFREDEWEEEARARYRLAEMEADFGKRKPSEGGVKKVGRQGKVTWDRAEGRTQLPPVRGRGRRERREGATGEEEEKEEEGLDWAWDEAERLEREALRGGGGGSGEAAKEKRKGEDRAKLPELPLSRSSTPIIL